MKVKPSILAALAFTFVASVPLVHAQDSAPPPPPPPADGGPGPGPGPGPGGGGGGPRWGKGRDPLLQVSNVTDDQKAKAEAIRTATRAKIEALPDDDDKREKIGELMRDQNSQVRALLTPDQQKEFDAAVKKMMRRRRKAESQDAPPPPPPPPAAAPSSS